jgi:hypothetical protein
MPGIETKVIQELDGQIVALEETIKKGGDKARENLKSINVEAARKPFVDPSSQKFDENLWNALKDKQQEVYDRLSSVKESLLAAAGLDGPTDPNHIMFDDYASSAAIIWLTILSFGLMFLLLGGVVWQWNLSTDLGLARKMQAAKPLFDKLQKAKQDFSAAEKDLNSAKKDFDVAKKKVEEAKAVKKDAQETAAGAQTEKTQEEAQRNLEVMTKKQAEAQKALEVMTTRQSEAQTEVGKADEGIPPGGATEGTVLTMVILLGALGGTLHLVNSLFKYVGNRQFKRSWILYYLAMPLTGAGLAPVVYLLLRVGIITPSGVSADGSSLANLNLMVIYAFALLTGMFSRSATDKLSEIFGTVFRTGSAPTKDALGSKKPPAANLPGASQTP